MEHDNDLEFENKAPLHPTTDMGGPSEGEGEEDKQSDLDVPGGKGLVKEEPYEQTRTPV